MNRLQQVMTHLKKPTVGFLALTATAVNVAPLGSYGAKAPPLGKRFLHSSESRQLYGGCSSTDKWSASVSSTAVNAGPGTGGGSTLYNYYCAAPYQTEIEAITCPDNYGNWYSLSPSSVGVGANYFGNVPLRTTYCTGYWKVRLRTPGVPAAHTFSGVNWAAT